MARILWSEPARCDIVQIRTRISRVNPEGASEIAARIRSSILRLEDFPRLGKPVETPADITEEVREFLLPPYAVRYLLDSDRVIIVRVWDMRYE